MAADRSSAARRRRDEEEARSAPASAGSGRGKRAKPVPERLDELIHQRTRLGILSALASSDPLSFNDLKAITGATDGNLSVHARKLEEAGYVKCTKRFSGRMPLTEYSMTTEGRKELERYLAHMEAIIKAARG